jgi:hypothetical protein
MFLDFVAGSSDPKDFLGKGCRVVMKHNPGKGKHAGKTFANLADVRDYDGELPPISQPPVYFDFDNPTKEDLEKLFPWEVDYLKEAVNYPGSKVEELVASLEDGKQEAVAHDEPAF